MLARRFQPRRNAEDRTNEKGGIARWEKENVGLKKKKKNVFTGYAGVFDRRSFDRNQRMYRSRMCAGIRKCNTRTGRFREENGG